MTDQAAATAEAAEFIPGSICVQNSVSVDLVRELDRASLARMLGDHAADAARDFLSQEDSNG